MKRAKSIWKILATLTLAALLLNGLANLPGKSEVLAASELAQLIEEQAKEMVEVTVDGQQYYIVTLENYIDPSTLELSPTDSRVKVYTNTTWEPISDPDIAQKVGRIDFARRFQNIVGSPDDISRIIQNMEDRLYYHRIIRLGEVLTEAHAKAMAIAIRGYITAGTSIPEDTISAVEDITSSFVQDPQNLLAGVVYEDFSDAEEEYNEVKEIAQAGDITDYATAYNYLNHFFTGNMYQYPAFHLLDKIDEIDKSLSDEFRDFAIQVADEILGGYYGNVEALLGDLKTISWVVTYCEERSEAESLIQEVLSKSNWASRYTLALASGGGSAEDATAPETYITQAPNGIATSADVAFSWSGSDDVTPTSELVYSYYLDGFNSGWSSWTPDTSKEYTGLVTADYVFKVKAKDQTGNVDPSPAEISFSSGIDVEDADSVQRFDMVPSDGLFMVASEVSPRVIIEYANSMRHQNLVSLPSELIGKVSEASPRVIIEYANSMRHQNLIPLPSQLLARISEVSPRVIIEYANSIYCYVLQEPFVTNNPPNQPDSPSPAHETTGVPVDADLSWTGGDPDVGDTVTYDVCFGTSASPPLVSNDQTATTHNPGTLGYNTRYYWKVVATDNHAASAEGSLWDFTTSSDGAVTTVVIDPAAQTVSQGEQFTLDILVTPAVAIAGAQCNISFDSSLITADLVTEGDLLSQGGAGTFFLEGTIDNMAGTITGMAAAITEAATVSDEEVFATITFTADATNGDTPITLSNVIVADATGDPVAIEVSDGSVTVMAVVAPTVTTNAASPVEETTATPNGVLDDDGGEACQYRFGYSATQGGPYIYTPWSGDTKTTGQPFNQPVSSLDKGTKYYFIAQAKNSGGTSSGSELSLLTKPDAPTSFSAMTASSSRIDLSWSKGDGADKTKIQRKEGSYPANKDDGTQVYFDTASSTSDTGLTPGTTYYYRVWSEVSGSQQWSDNYAQDWATTGTQPNNPPDTPSNPSPANHATGVFINADLRWIGGDPDVRDTVTYDVYFGTNSTPPFRDTIGPYATNQTSISYDPGALSYNATYYWQIVARDNHGIIKEGPLWDFTTQPSTMKLIEGVNVIPYTGVTTDLPEALTNIGLDGMDVVTIIWARAAWTGGQWLYYNPAISFGTLSELENGRAYIIVVTEDCTWNLPH